MRSGRSARGVLLLAALMGAASFVVPSAAQERPKELLEKLQRVGLDPANSYQVADLRLRQDAIRLSLHHGTLVFFEPVDGRVTGAVFEGSGEVLVLPPDLPERQQMAKFT